jgi:hypothetical protein
MVDNTMIDNTMIDNTMVKRKRTNNDLYKTLHKKLKFEQQEPQ